ncbi:MAG TPA: rhomboid family intramembrane serine protease [Micromonosporaceae bacterium]
MSDVSPVTAPVCYRHPGRETYVRCTRCDRPICPDCMREASVGHQCPECVAEGRRTQRPARTAFGGSAVGARGYVTKALVAINVVMLVLSALSAGNAGRALAGGNMGGLLGGPTPLLDWGGVFGYAPYVPGGAVHGVAAGEYYRLVTAMFLHFGLIHLAANMWALWVLGRNLEAALGPLRFLALYLLAGLGGNVAAYVFQPHALTAGASTALFGLFAALFVILRRLGRSAAGVLPVLVLNLVITFTIPGISIAGHLGGLVTGAVVAAGMAYAPRGNRTAVQVGVCLIVVALLGLVTFWQTSTLIG